MVPVSPYSERLPADTASLSQVPFSLFHPVPNLKKATLKVQERLTFYTDDLPLSTTSLNLCVADPEGFIPGGRLDPMADDIKSRLRRLSLLETLCIRPLYDGWQDDYDLEDKDDDVTAYLQALYTPDADGTFILPELATLKLKQVPFEFSDLRTLGKTRMLRERQRAGGQPRGRKKLVIIIDDCPGIDFPPVVLTTYEKLSSVLKRRY